MSPHTVSISGLQEIKPDLGLHVAHKVLCSDHGSTNPQKWTQQGRLEVQMMTIAVTGHAKPRQGTALVIRNIPRALGNWRLPAVNCGITSQFPNSLVQLPRSCRLRTTCRPLEYSAAGKPQTNSGRSRLDRSRWSVFLRISFHRAPVHPRCRPTRVGAVL